MLVVGTSAGLLLIYENTELKREINVWEKEESEKNSLTSTRTNSLTSGVTPLTQPVTTTFSPELAITAVAAGTKGLMCACLGVIMFLEKSQTRDIYKRPRIIEIPRDPYSAVPFKSGELLIQNIIISPTEEHILCVTDQGLMFEYVASTNTMKEELGTLVVVQCRPHVGAVVDVDVCIRKPLAVTCGLDRYVRLWNLETKKLELYKQFADDPLSIAIHPTGLFIIVTFANNVSFMNILMDDFTPFKEFQLRRCREVSFSRGGHYFTLVYGNLIQTYSTTTFEQVALYRGHDGKVSSVVWSADDTRLVSVGLDGAVYEWDVVTARRLGENVIKGCGYVDVALTPDGKQTFALGNDRIIKEMLDSQINRLIDCKEILTCLVVSSSGRVMFAGTSGGAVRSFKFPLSLPFSWTDYQAHSSPVTKIKISYDDQYLVSISDDATVVIWQITDKNGESLSRDKKLAYSNEILITKSELQEKNELTEELKSRVSELANENQYQLRQRDVTYNAKIKELADTLLREIDQLKSVNKTLRGEKDRSEMQYEEKMLDIDAKHTKALSDQDLANRKKLVLEYEMYHDLEQRSQTLQADYERQLRVLEQTMDSSMEQQAEQYEQKLTEANEYIERLNTALEELRQEKEKELRQVELDVDEEIQTVKERYELLLDGERAKIDQLKLEVLSMKKKDTRVAMQIEDQKEQIKKNLQDIRKLTQSCRSLSAEISQLKNERKERDEIIQNKEKRIYELRKMNQDLEKFRYVMDHKIAELQQQLERRDDRMRCMAEEIEEMQKDLLMFQGQFDKWERDSVSWKMKFLATDNESLKSKQSAHMSTTLLQRIKVDLHMCVGLIQSEKKLKDSITSIYHKYVTQADIRGEVKFDKDVETEYIEQIDHLERTVADKTDKLGREVKDHTLDNFKIMQENGLMHVAINELRRELARERSKMSELISALGVYRKSAAAIDALDLIRQIARNTKNAELARQLSEAHRAIEAQRHLAGTLRRTVCQLEHRVADCEEELDDERDEASGGRDAGEEEEDDGFGGGEVKRMSSLSRADWIDVDNVPK